MKNVLSIQSWVTYGHVGNAAALLPLQRLGHNVWPLNTVHYSNHLGHPTWRGSATDADVLSDIVTGLSELGVLANCDALLTGFLGERRLGGVVVDTLDRLRAANADTVYACDPVMGDDGIGYYVGSGMPEFMRDELVPRADILLPNRFELEFLVDRPIAAFDEALAAIDEVRGWGPRTVVCTSLPLADGGERIGTLVVDDEGAWRVSTPRLETSAYGTGDVFAALFLGHSLHGADTAKALSHSVSALYAILAATAAAGHHELVLVEAQEAIVSPPEIFAAERVR